jgi:uncharacterized membrane protein YdjX (TVP38/TMEM64 family)
MPSRRLLKIAIAATIGAIVIAVYLSPARDYLSREQIGQWIGTLRAIWWGPIAFMVVYALACVLVLPASVFVIAAGVIWGWLLGGTYALIAGLTGAAASFLLGRFLGEGILERFGTVGRFVQRRVDHAGFRSLLVLRFVPGIPFAVVNYGAGVARVRFSDFALATVLGLIPSNYIFAYCADELFNGTMSEGDALRRLTVAAVLLISLVLLSTFLRKRSGIEVPSEP